MDSKLQKPQWLYRLQQKWGLANGWQAIAVLATFTLAGSSVVWCRRGLFWLLGYNDQTAFWIKAVTYVMCLFPMYQILLLFYGSLLGQFRFFWEKEYKMYVWLKKRFVTR